MERYYLAVGFVATFEFVFRSYRVYIAIIGVALHRLGAATLSG